MVRLTQSGMNLTGFIKILWLYKVQLSQSGWERTYLMSSFLRSKRHLLQLQEPNWGQERIFHQLALEHADELFDTACRKMVEANQVGWDYWRRKRRSSEVPVNPCLQTLLTKEEEWASIEEWQGIMVAYDCSSYLWVWDHHSNDVLLHIEITGYTCGQGRL